jgi:hypothetical protein
MRAGGRMYEGYKKYAQNVSWRTWKEKAISNM